MDIFETIKSWVTDRMTAFKQDINKEIEIAKLEVKKDIYEELEGICKARSQAIEDTIKTLKEQS